MPKKNKIKSRKTAQTASRSRSMSRFPVTKNTPGAVSPGYLFDKGALLACGAFSILAALFLWPYITHPTWVPSNGDMEFVWVYRHVWIEALKRGYPILWNPYSNLGQPFLANCNPQVYAPFNFLFLLFSTSYAFTWSYFCHFVLAGLGAYLFTRSLGTGRLGGVLAGMAFAFSGFFMAHFVWGGHNSINGSSWIPLVLYGLKRFTDTRHLSALLIAAGAFGCCALDGTPQYDLYTLMAAGFFLAWVWIRDRSRWREVVAGGAVFLVLGLSLGLCQLAPTLQLSLLSNRTTWGMDRIMVDDFDPGNFRFLIDPFFNGVPLKDYHGRGGYAEVCIYVGLIPLFLAILGLGALRKKTWVPWLGLLALLSAVLAMADTTVVTHYLYLFFSKLIPGLSQNRQPSRVLILATLALAALSGLALDSWSSHWRAKNRLSGPRRTLLALGIPLLLILGTAVDLYRFDAQHAAGYGGSDQFYGDLFPPDFLKIVKADSTYPRVQPAASYCEFQMLQNLSSAFTDCTSFFIKTGRKYTEEQYGHPDSPLSDLIRLLYDYRSDRTQPTARWQRIPGLNVPIWKNNQAYPRSFMIGGYEVNPDFGQVIEAIRDGKMDPRQQLVLAQEPSEKPQGPKGWVGEATITGYDYNDVNIECSNDKPCFLFLSDCYYPGWKAWVDGVEKPIYQADGTFRAVPLLDAGRHQVKMSYYPPIIVWTFFYSLMAWIALIGGWFFREKLDRWAAPLFGTH